MLIKVLLEKFVGLIITLLSVVFLIIPLGPSHLNITDFRSIPFEPSTTHLISCESPTIIPRCETDGISDTVGAGNGGTKG